MPWSEQIYRYCERGQDSAFWAEPLNALSNLAFIVAAMAAGLELRRTPGRRVGPEAVLVTLVFVIGIGSFLFHTFATRWAAAADVIPIALFMLAYVVYALRVFAGLGWFWVGVGVVLFLGSLRGFSAVVCQPGLISIVEAVRSPCLNGTVGYGPAALALLLVGAALTVMRRPAGLYLLSAAALFLVSMALRSVDVEVCGATMVFGRPIGTHALWHVCNGITLYILLCAAIRHGRPPVLANR